MVTTFKKSRAQNWTWSGTRFVRKTPTQKQTTAQKVSLTNSSARYYDPATGEFISQDPLEYVDGMSQYRAYFVPGGMDPNGMLKFNFKDCRLTLKYQIQVFFYSGSGGDWTAAEKAAWQVAAENAIENSWNGKQTLHSDDWVVPPIESGQDLWKNDGVCYATRCPCHESGVSVEVDIEFDTGYWSYDEDHEVSVYKIPAGGFRGSFIGGWGSQLDSEDVNPRTDQGAPGEIPIAHEFGHMIELNHPSHGQPGVTPNSGPEYLTPSGNPTTIGSAGDNIMGSGMGLLPEHAGFWKSEMKRLFPECDYDVK